MSAFDPLLPVANGSFRAIKSRTSQKKRIFGNASLDANPYFFALIASIWSMMRVMRAASVS
jgi:hypothetical protein